jgi:hypothetical protein
MNAPAIHGVRRSPAVLRAVGEVAGERIVHRVPDAVQAPAHTDQRGLEAEDVDVEELDVGAERLVRERDPERARCVEDLLRAGEPHRTVR